MSTSLLHRLAAAARATVPATVAASGSAFAATRTAWRFVPLGVSLIGAAVLVLAPLLPADAGAQTGATAAVAGTSAAEPLPPSVRLAGKMVLAAKAGTPPRVIPVTLTPRPGGAYQVRYDESLRCDLVLNYNGYVAGTGHLYTPAFVSGGSGGMASYCNSVGGKPRTVVLNPRKDGPGFDYEDYAPTGAKAVVTPSDAARAAP